MNREQSKTSRDMEKAVNIQGEISEEKMQKSSSPPPNGTPPENDLDGEFSGLDGRVQAHLGRLLRARYRELLEEPIPDKLKLHLEELAKRERKP